MNGSGLASAAAGGILALVVAVAVVTAAVVLGVPWLWSVLKPILHALTA